MRKIIILFVLLIFSLCCYAEENESEGNPQAISEVTSKMLEMDARIDRLSTEVKKMQEEIEKIKESLKLLSNTIRDLQIYTQGEATIKPDEDTWKSIKNGMTIEEVKDILGSPEEVSIPRGGGEIWYYYGLGSITFDGNGRVISQKTFKQFPLEKKVR